MKDHQPGFVPFADGWIEWGGGDRPVDFNQMVDVRHRNGIENTARAGAWRACWHNDNHPGDIVAYRIAPEGAKS